MKNKWILVNIGCIECGVSSNIVGVFTSKNEASDIAKKLNEKGNWRESGQNSYEIFKMLTLNKINEEYLEYLE